MCSAKKQTYTFERLQKITMLVSDIAAGYLISLTH